MKSDKRAISRILGDLNRRQEHEIDAAARAGVKEVARLEFKSSSEGVLSDSVQELRLLLRKVYAIEQNQEFTALDILLPWRRDKAAQRVNERKIFRGHQSRFIESLTEMYPSSGHQPKIFEYVAFDGDNSYLVELTDSKTETPDGTFVHGWLFVSSHIPYGDGFTGKRLKEGGGTDLDIYRFTRLEGDQYGKSDVMFHIRHNASGELVSFWAFGEGERLDDYRLIGSDSIQTAQGLINQASQELGEHLSTKRR